MSEEMKRLDALFALARSDAPLVPASLTERVMADALREMPAAPQQQVVIRPAGRGFLGLGWLQASALAGVMVVGVAIGILSPGISENLMGDTYSLADLMPGFDVDFAGGVEG